MTPRLIRRRVEVVRALVRAGDFAAADRAEAELNAEVLEYLSAAPGPAHRLRALARLALSARDAWAPPDPSAERVKKEKS